MCVGFATVETFIVSRQRCDDIEILGIHVVVVVVVRFRRTVSLVPSRGDGSYQNLRMHLVEYEYEYVPAFSLEDLENIA